MEFEYDLVVLDSNLPGVDGLSVLKRLRQRKANVPAMILTARTGLKTGCGSPIANGRCNT